MGEEGQMVVRTITGERVKVCVGCGRHLPLTYSFSECNLCLMNRDEGGSG